MEEIWKNVPEYPDYHVSNLGRVKSLKFGKERMLKPILMPQGYYQIKFSKNGKVKRYTIHSLVVVTFMNHVPNKYETVVDHINSIKTDNRLENLRLVTHRENITFGNLKKETSSKYTGVYWSKQNKKWMARIGINGKQNYLGYFTSEIEAAQAYQKALKSLV
jgi:hypothetical protein